MAKPRTPFDWSKLDGMLIFDASKVACAMFLNVSADTIERRIKEKHKMTFTEYKHTHVEQTVLRLKQRMIKKAFEGDNTCLIFSLKNLSDWSDKQEVDHQGQGIQVNYVTKEKK